MNFRSDILPLKDQLYRLALRITLNPQEAEDVVQDTMIKVWNKKEQWDEIESIEAFCMTICRNLALDQLRKKENQNHSIEDISIERPDKAPSPQELAEQSDNIERIKALMAKLPEKQRTCMQLRDFEGKNYKEIATILEIKEDQVKVNIFRARKAIKEEFFKQENFHA